MVGVGGTELSSSSSDGGPIFRGLAPSDPTDTGPPPRPELLPFLATIIAPGRPDRVVAADRGLNVRGRLPSHAPPAIDNLFAAVGVRATAVSC